jgi:glycosyltransferase involved in cell wall biosynthesis
MKSLQICGNSSYGGGGYLLIRWCKYLLSRGWQVDVLATHPEVVAELKRIPDLRVIESIYIPRDIAPTRDVQAFIQLLLLLHRENYDVVHTYTATPSFLGRIAARLVGIPVILHHQAGWTVTDFSSWLERVVFTPLEYLAAVASTKSICVSHAVAQQAHQLHIAPGRKLVTICNGIQPRTFIEATGSIHRQAYRHEFGIPSNHLLIGNTGRLAPQKDNDTLIQAMACLKSLIGDIPFTLLLAGEGPDRKRLEDLVHSLGLKKKVRFLGFRRDIPAFLAGLDIFVSPSLREGLSISLLEAMAAARPIVTTSILPNAELIEHEVTGLLVPPRSPKRIAESITRFAREPALAQRCAMAARQRVLEHYTIERMFQETWNLYIDLLKEKQPDRMSAYKQSTGIP